MHEWAKCLKLPKRGFVTPGPFSTEISRYMNGVMEAIQDERVRRVTVCKAVQTGGTLCAAEIPIIYFLLNAPGDIIWTHQTEPAAKDHAKTRWNPLLKRIPQIRAMMPRSRHNDTTLQVMFPDCFLILNAANLGSMQSKSARYKINSECWLWPQGMMAMAESRVSKYDEVGTSKVINESQASLQGDDFHKAFMAGDQSTWSVKCFGCGKYSPLEFFGKMKGNEEVRACVIWEESAKNADGTWDVEKAAGSARWKCPECGFEHEDTPRTRALWNAEGTFIPQRLDFSPAVRSFRWNSLVSRTLYELVKQFLDANAEAKRGLTEALKTFKMQRLALFWKDDVFDELVPLRGAGYLLSSPNIADKIVNESMRYMTIDRQRDHFWVVIRAWRFDGSSRLLYFSRTQTVEQLVDLAQLFHVEPRHVFEDTGYFPDGGYADCAKYGWTALKGSGELSFPVEVKGVKFRRMWSMAVRVQKDDRYIPLIHWASDPIKDVLHNLRSGKGVKWETPDDLSPEYENHMSGDRKKPFENKKSGRQEWRWQRVHANHAWDCEAMQVGAALMTGILSSPEAPKEPEIPATPAT